VKRILLSAAVVLAAAGFVFVAGGASNPSAQGSYKIELDNAFGLVTGADFKVAGVPAGTISAINLDQKTLHAVVTINVTRGGFGDFHTSAFCQTRPESLIGEYYIDCNPGTSGPVLKPGGTIPVSHTESTIPADLLQNVMRLPYRERFALIVNELGAAAAARSDDLAAALHRAVPALDETDKLLNLLANDSSTLKALTTDANTVITALANNRKQVQRFIVEANRTATATASQAGNLKLTLHKLPGLLEQLRPTMAKLGTTVTTYEPVLSNLDQASGEVNRLLRNLPPFSRSAKPAIKSLGQASVTGKQAVQAATPTVAALNRFAQPTPELAKNLSIVLPDLDTQSRAVERDPRSPGGKGFSGLQALLGYVFNQALAINTYGPFGHVLAVDAFFSKMCSPYATPATVAMALKAYGSAYRQCYSWLGPSQPGVNETDPTDPSAPVPDPGGAPPGQHGPVTDAARLTAARPAADVTGPQAHRASTKTRPAEPKPKPGSSSSGPTGSGASSTGAAGSGSLSTGATGSGASSTVAAGSGSLSTGATGSGATGQAQRLLNYLLAP
jgi:virulence factor Mce-like protein